MINVLIWLPFAVALIAAAMPRRAVGPLNAAGALATLALAAALAIGFETGGGLQHAVDLEWIGELGIHYRLGVDGISLFLIVLTALLWAAATVWSAFEGVERPRLYFAMLGLAESATLGAFCAQDLLLFVLFFDLMLVPFYFLIGAWGGPGRVAATTKMIIYTLVGSLLMLVGAIATGVLAAPEIGGISFSLAELEGAILPESTQRWIFWAFAAAFLVKMPAFPIHGWMPDAYRAAPLPVLLVLSGVLSKVGAYGFLRIVLPLFPDASIDYQETLLVIACASILYGSAMAFTQTSARLIAGYSSVAQLGFVTLGIFALHADGAGGAVLHMVNHGLVVAPVFVVIGVLVARAGSDDIRRLGGIATRAPVLAALFLVVTLATLAMPGSANFIGELYILIGAFGVHPAWAIVASLGVALAAFYALRLYQRTMHGRAPEGLVPRELSLREGAVLAPLVAAIVALALYPGLVLSRADAPVAAKVAAVEGRR